VSKVRANIAISLDGYVAGPNQSEENPLGEGGGELHNWMFPLRAWRESHGQQGGEENPSNGVIEEWLENVGDVKLEQLRAVEAPGVAHLKYRVVR
jgi:hypothetical protein